MYDFLQKARYVKESRSSTEHSHPFFHFFQFNLRFFVELHLFQWPLDLWLSTLGLGSSLLNPNVQALNIAVLIGIGLLAVLRNQSGGSGNAEIRRVHEWWCWSSCWYCLAGGGLAPVGSSDSVAVQDFTNPSCSACITFLEDFPYYLTISWKILRTEKNGDFN